MRPQYVIEKLGYSHKEAKVYLAALSLGEAHVSDIAKQANLPRSTAQVIIDRLHQDGLINFYVMRRYKYWVAENPEKLLEIIKKQEVTVREALPKLTEIKQAGRQRFNQS